MRTLGPLFQTSSSSKEVSAGSQTFVLGRVHKGLLARESTGRRAAPGPNTVLLAAAPSGRCFPAVLRVSDFLVSGSQVQETTSNAGCQKLTLELREACATLLPLKILGKERPHIFTPVGPWQKAEQHGGLVC